MEQGLVSRQKIGFALDSWRQIHSQVNMKEELPYCHNSQPVYSVSSSVCGKMKLLTLILAEHTKILHRLFNFFFFFSMVYACHPCVNETILPKFLLFLLCQNHCQWCGRVVMALRSISLLWMDWASDPTDKTCGWYENLRPVCYRFLYFKEPRAVGRNPGNISEEIMPTLRVN